MYACNVCMYVCMYVCIDMLFYVDGVFTRGTGSPG